MNLRGVDSSFFKVMGIFAGCWGYLGFMFFFFVYNKRHNPGVDSNSILSTIVLFKNQILFVFLLFFLPGFWRIFKKKDPWVQNGWKVPIEI